MDSKSVVLRYVEAFNRGDLEGVIAQFAPDAKVWGVLGWGSLDVARPVWGDLIRSLRMQLQVESLVAEGNLVAARYTETGTAVAPFRGMPATQRSYSLTAMEFFEIEGGLIRKRWGARDSASQAKQLGWT